MSLILQIFSVNLGDCSYSLLYSAKQNCTVTNHPSDQFHISAGFYLLTPSVKYGICFPVFLPLKNCGCLGFFFPKVRTFSIKLCFCGFLMERMEVTCFLCITTPMNISSLVFSLALMCKYSFSLSRSSWSQRRCFLHGQPSNLVGLEPALEVLYAICFFRMQFTSEYCEIYSGGSSVNLSHSIRLCQGRTGILLLFMSICS